MTLSTDNRRSRRPTSVRMWAYGAGVGLAVALGALALAAPSTYGQGEGSDSAYSRPTQALNGQSLASYVAKHQADRLTRSR